ncbi:MAG: MFS transporter [Burkholderiales bacterium]|nr:MFS transporter [Burkholderiales bacterium]
MRLRSAATAVLATCFALNLLGRGMGDTYTVFLKPIEGEFGWNRSQLTSVYSVYLLVNGLLAPLVGLAFDRAGPRLVYTAGLAILGTAFVLAGSLQNLWHFYLLVGAMVGVGVSCTGMVPASALLARWYRAKLSIAIGIAFSGIGVGTVVLVPFAQYLVSGWSWRTAYHTLGALLLGAAALTGAALPWRRFAAGDPSLGPAPRRAGEAAGGWTLARALGSPVYWGLAQVFFCTATGMFAVVVQLVAFLIDAGFSPLAAATVYGLTGMLSSVSVMSSGFVAERFGYARTVTASFAGSMTGVLLLLAVLWKPSWVLVALFVPVFGLCMGVRGPIISSVCTRHFAGPRVATIYGTIYATNALGAALGSLAGGLLHDATGGYVAGCAFALGCLALAAVPFLAVPGLREFR